VRSAHDISAIEWLTGATAVAALTVVPLALLTAQPGDLRAIGGADWLWLALIIGVTGLTGHALMSWATKWIDASRSSLYVLAMHIVAVGAAWLIHDEAVSPVQALGGVVVLVAVGAVVSRPA
jgi:drug/metabolite transporter (DMT)-like permease